MDRKCYEMIEQKMCKELEMLEAKFAQNPSQDMSMQDLEKIDKLYHALKSMATYNAMKEAENYEDEEWNDGYSGRRGRGMNGRYVSRTGNDHNSYDDGYRSGYSDGQQSGYYHPMIPRYAPRTW